MAVTNDRTTDVQKTSNLPPRNREEHPHHRHSVGYWIVFAIAVLVIAALVYFYAWLPRKKQRQEVEQETQQRAQAIPKVQVLKVETAPSASVLQIPGTTLAYTQANVYARASGYVSRRLVDIGDRVRQGQLLATIDAPDLDKQVAQARSNLAQSQSNLVQLQAQLHLQALNWDRYKVLVAKGVFSRQQGDQQEADFRVAEANVRTAESTVQANRDNLDRLVVLQQYEQVTAPFSGVITARNVDVGALINSGGAGLGSSSSSSPDTTLAGAQGNNAGGSGALSSSVSPSTGGSQGGEMFGIASLDPLRILVSIPEAYSNLVRVGDHADLFFQEQPEEKVRGTVTRTSASIDTNTRTLLVEVQVRNRSGKLLPGMYVVVNFIQMRERPPLMVPGEAVVVRNGRNTVAVVDGGNVIHFRPIQIGRDFGNETEIVSGLQAGDMIATIISDEVREGVKIEPVIQQQQVQPPGGQNDRRPGEEGRYGNQGLTNQGGASAKSGGQKGGGAGKSNSGKSGSSAQPNSQK